jgi:hypothetical protein
MQHFSIEPLELRIAPATVLTGAVFTPDFTVVSGVYNGTANATIELFAGVPGETAVSLGSIRHLVADGPNFSVNAPALDPWSLLTAIATPDGGISDTEAVPIGATRGLWVEGATIGEGDGTRFANFKVKLSLPSASPITVSYATSSDTAVAGQDFTPTTGTLVFAPGETEKTVPVAILGDTLPENTESFVLLIGDAAGATIARSEGIAGIVDNDALSSTSTGVYLEPTAFLESAGNASVEVRLTRPSAVSVYVDYATSDGTTAAATVGSDFVATTGRITFAAGETTKTILIPIVNDSIFEGRENFRIRLTDATSELDIISPEIPVTILNDDATSGPLVAISDATIVEGTSTSVNSTISFVVSLSKPAVETVVLKLSSGSNTAGLSDYQGGTGTLVIEAGESEGTIELPVRADNFPELNESFFISVDSLVGAVSSDTFAIGTINNDDSGLPVLEINDVTVLERDTTGANAVFTITLSQPSTSAVTVNLATGQGTAIPDIDYAAAGGTLTFSAGETSKSVSIAIQGDTAYESDESFGLGLSAAVGATIADNLGVATILDNDPINTGTPQLRILDHRYSEGTGSNTQGVVRIVLDHAAPTAVSVELRYRNGTAIVGDDIGAGTLQVNIPAGADTGTSAFTIGADFSLENDEFFYVDVVSATGANIQDRSGRVTLVNDDAGPVISEDQKSATWRDVDGDFITLKASKGILTTANFAMLPLNGGLLLGALIFNDPIANGLSFSIAAKGPGKTINMGGILAEGLDLGTIKIAGDISRIIAGSGGNLPAIANLDVFSIGASGAANDLGNSTLSQIRGNIGAISIQRNFESAILYVDSGARPSIGNFKIAGQLKGGSSDGAGYIFASGDIGTIDIRGGIAGGAGFYSGSIQTLGRIQKITVGGDITGAGGIRSGAIFAHGFHASTAAGIGNISVKGSLSAGSGNESGGIYSYGTISNFKIGRNFTGGFIISGGIDRLAIGGDVIGADILTGYTVSGTGFTNPTTSVAPLARATAGYGKLTIGGNWVASTLAADISPGTDQRFGTPDDLLIFNNTTAAIKSIIIKGTVAGTSAVGDSFGFVARTIGIFKSANSAPTLSSTAADVIPIGGTGDVALREIVA